MQPRPPEPEARGAPARPITGTLDAVMRQAFPELFGNWGSGAVQDAVVAAASRALSEGQGPAINAVTPPAMPVVAEQLPGQAAHQASSPSHPCAGIGHWRARSAREASQSAHRSRCVYVQGWRSMR